MNSIEMHQDEVHVRTTMKGTVLVKGVERHLNTTPFTVWRKISGAWQLVRFETKKVTP